MEVNKGLRRKVRRANFRSARIPPMEANTRARSQGYTDWRARHPTFTVAPEERRYKNVGPVWRAITRDKRYDSIWSDPAQDCWGAAES